MQLLTIRYAYIYLLLVNDFGCVRPIVSDKWFIVNLTIFINLGILPRIKIQQHSRNYKLKYYLTRAFLTELNKYNLFWDCAILKAISEILRK